MRYVIAKFAEKQKELSYRIYLTDTLFYYTDNKRVTKRFYDVMFPAVQDKRTGDEIVMDVIKKLELKVE